jgi:hypothetical protein
MVISFVYSLIEQYESFKILAFLHQTRCSKAVEKADKKDGWKPLQFRFVFAYTVSHGLLHQRTGQKDVRGPLQRLQTERASRDH